MNFLTFRLFRFLRAIYWEGLVFVQHVGYGILVPRPGIEPAPPAVEARTLKHWGSPQEPI